MELMIDVLVVENDIFFSKLLKYILESERLNIQVIDNLSEAYQFLQLHPPLMLIQSDNMTDGDAFQFCKKLSLEKSDIPIIFISPNSNIDYKIEVLQYTTDYIIRPFEPLELLARTKAILKRIKYRQNLRRQEQLCISGITLLMSNFEVKVAQHHSVFLTPSETRILEHLMRNAGRIVTRENLKSQLLNENNITTSNVIDVCISRIRQKIDRNNNRPIYIETIKGLGYRFNIISVKP
jgi:DNA-binding response OmpR family regulator